MTLRSSAVIGAAAARLAAAVLLVAIDVSLKKVCRPSGGQHEPRTVGIASDRFLTPS
jgi:hypothetical protein